MISLSESREIDRNAMIIVSAGNCLFTRLRTISWMDPLGGGGGGDKFDLQDRQTDKQIDARMNLGQLCWCENR